MAVSSARRYGVGFFWRLAATDLESIAFKMWSLMLAKLLIYEKEG
jgi:hypothetical protein